MRRWWHWALAAMAALVAILGRRRSPWKARAEKSQDAAEGAAQQAVRDAAAAEIREADDELARKRAADDDDRLRAALARAAAERARRNAGKPGPG